MKTEEILKSLCQSGGISGDERKIQDIFVDLISPYCDEFQSDVMGNVWARKKNAQGKTIMLEAHADKIGLMISGITDEGFLLFAEIGGYDKKIMPSTLVTVFGKETVHGVIGSVPPHLKKKQKFTSDDLCIDIGMSKCEAEKIISVGDLAEFDTEYTPLLGERAAASAFDDRAGLAAIVKAVELLKDDSVNVVAAASTQEEVGCRGAKCAAYNINPDVYICIDVCHGKTPDADKNVFALGGGPVITVGPNVQPYVSKKLISTASDFKIDYQIDVDSGNTGTNAWTVQIARMGIPTGLVSLPLRYMHTRYEVLSLKDIDLTAQLLAEFARRC
ncbi:MAG: M20/M25/M40 family metallo-hydrolase [Clostridia bacterium]|nr:M20/M25/M40 family metallo-hydrolase [Clostridia bacterium]